ncbi:MAG: hypothetical protein C4525_03260 [Desulfarculus sp.]|jgi:hypothetical protein|nr:MAG: hypothetical protein C4525_03260 [Desulfarculus sp.]
MPAVDECHAPRCVVCGEPLPAGSRSNTCSPECRQERRRQSWRAYYCRRQEADPEHNRRRHARRRERLLADPQLLADHRARERERERARMRDPQYRQRARAHARTRYARDAQRVQARRREIAAILPPQEADRRREQSRAHGRRYRRKWRRRLWADAGAHRAYKRQMAEYRRRAALRNLVGVVAPILAERRDKLEE